MNILAFETASPSGGVALLSGARVLGEFRVNHSQSHSKVCLRYASELLAVHGMEWDDLTAVATSVGPGSFIGVRVGVTLAKGIGYSCRLPVVGVSTLEALAGNVYTPGETRPIVPLLDARSNELYGCVYRAGKSGLEAEADEFCLSLEQLLSRLPDDCLFLGEGALKFFEGKLDQKGVLASPQRVLCGPASVAVLASARYSPERNYPPEKLKTVYLRQAVDKKKTK